MEAILNRLKQSKMHNTRRPVSGSVVKQRQISAQAICADWASIAPLNIVNLIESYAGGIGAPNELIFFPFLSAASSMLSSKSCIRLTPHWTEPPIIWTVVAADEMCRKKSAAFRLIQNVVRDVEKFVRTEAAERNHLENFGLEGVPHDIPTIHMTDSDFKFSRLRNQMRENSGECLLLSRDLATLYEELERKQEGSSQKSSNRDIFLGLHSGDVWPVDEDERSSLIDATQLNYTGFIEPEVVISMMNNAHDFPGFIDRNIAIVCPKPTKVYFQHLIQSSANCVPMADIFLALRKAHRKPVEYQLDEEAREVFATFYNSIEDRMETTSSDEIDYRRILSKSQGQVARLAMVLHCVHHATQYVVQQQEQMLKLEFGGDELELIPPVIPASIMYYAVNLMELCISHKVALMPSTTSVQFGRNGVPTHKEQQPATTTQTRPPIPVDIMTAPQLNRVSLAQAVTVPAPSARQAPLTVMANGSAPGSSVPVGPAPTLHTTPALIPLSTVTAVPRSMAQPRQVAVNLVPGGPEIVGVSYTPPGSSAPVQTRPSPATKQLPTVRIAKVNVPSTSRMVAIPVSGHRQPGNARSQPPATYRVIQPNKRVEAANTVATKQRLLLKKKIKKYGRAGTFQFTNKYPTSKDYENFVETCPRNVRSLLVYGKDQMGACFVAQRRLMPPLKVGVYLTPGKGPNKYPTHAARAYLTALAEAGLGQMVPRKGGRAGHSVFRKFKFHELSESARDIVRRLSVTPEELDKTDFYK